MAESPEQNDYEDNSVSDTNSTTCDANESLNDSDEKTNLEIEVQQQNMVESEEQTGIDIAHQISEAKNENDIEVKWNPAISRYVPYRKRVYKPAEAHDAQLIHVYKDGRWTHCNDEGMYAAVDMENSFILQIFIEYSTRVRTITIDQVFNDVAVELDVKMFNIYGIHDFILERVEAIKAIISSCSKNMPPFTGLETYTFILAFV